MGPDKIQMKNATKIGIHYHSLVVHSTTQEIIVDKSSAAPEDVFRSFIDLANHFRPDYFDESEVVMIEDLFYETIEDENFAPIKLGFGEVEFYIFACEECYPHSSN